MKTKNLTVLHGGILSYKFPGGVGLPHSTAGALTGRRNAMIDCGWNSEDDKGTGGAADSEFPVRIRPAELAVRLL